MKVLPKKFLLILGIFIFLLVCVLAKIFLFPVFETESVIMIDLKTSATSVQSERSSLELNITSVRNHMGLLKSEPILRSVVEDLKLYEDSGPLEQFVHRYVRKKELSPQESGAGPSVELTHQEKKIRETLNALRDENIVLESPPFTNLIHIIVRYKNAEKAAKIANLLVEKYIQWYVDILHQDVDRVIFYLESAVKKAEERLSLSEEALRDYKEQHEVVLLSEQIKKGLELQTRFQVDFDSAKINEQELKSEIELTREKIEAEKKNITPVSAVNNPILESMINHQLDLKLELSRLEELYTDNSPQIIYMKKRISMVEDDLNQALDQLMQSQMSFSAFNKGYENLVAGLTDAEISLQSVSVKKDEIKNLMADSEKFLSTIPEKELMISRLTRVVQINEEIYDLLMAELEKARLLRIKQTTEDIKVISAAVIPLKPKGRLKSLVLGLVMSLILAISLPLMFDYLSVRSSAKFNQFR